MNERLNKLAARAAELERQKMNLELDLQKVSDELKQLTDYDIPDEMMCEGISKAEYPDGTTVSLKKSYYGGISYEKGPEAFDLLDNLGYTLPWAVRTEVAKADAAGLVDLLKDCGYAAKAKPEINPQTFKKLCKDLDKQGMLDEKTQLTLGVVVKFSATLKVNN